MKMAVDTAGRACYDAVMRGSNLQRLRRLKGWTQQDLADASGIHQVSIARLEKDRHVAGAHTMARLADALGATIAELTGQ